MSTDMQQPLALHGCKPHPIAGLRGKDLLNSSRQVLTQTVRQPVHSARHLLRLGSALKDVLLDKSDLRPDPDDRRFSDPAWKLNPIYRRYQQAYLAWRKELHDWLETSNLPADDIRRGHFILNLLTEAMAPTNSLANPAAVKRLFETGGASLLKGLSQLSRDMVSNGGLPSQVNKAAFEVGRNLGTTPGSVVFRNELLELIQYQPTTEQVHTRPVLVVPPQINKFYIFDLSPDKSLARFSLDSGLQTFIISWRNPTRQHSHWDLNRYIEALKEAVDAVLAITGSPDLNMLGACSGGVTAAVLLGHYAALGDNRIKALTLMVSVLDTDFDSQYALFVDDKTLDAAKRRSSEAGVLEGRDLARVFAWMRPNDLIWNYWVNNYLLGNLPPEFDILYWNNDTTRLPAGLHHDMIELFRNNPLRTPGALEVCGTPIDLKSIEAEVFCIAGTTDHITPWQASYRSARLFGEHCEFVLSNSGHIQSILNPPGNPKARFLHGAALEEDPDAWKAGATEQRDSWWLYWRDWLQARSGELKKAPRRTGNRAFPAAEPAPGTYVHEC
ncbi:poly(R)-hydroxyalkanoic acid synthase [Pseudomonas flexibilis]|uniref:Poly(R)-hydroxyalkanoic acid synthase n=2 Tax=Pseudomonas TaxID=286 RepID=A0A0B3BZA8_9PSED|nr:poly(R)-hydroxyalkanoic acid synthase [Pseudomonas flexibilis]SCY00307.1 polyhydroxyalkanoate synthase [Pseudomonas flexibilis]